MSRIERTLSDRPVTVETAPQVLNQQVIPVLKRAREIINSEEWKLPVDTVYYNMSGLVDPATTLGYGTWVLLGGGPPFPWRRTA